MRNNNPFYINGQWVNVEKKQQLDVINPATEQVAGSIPLGNTSDVDAAVKAASHAFKTFGKTTRQERLVLLKSVSH